MECKPLLALYAIYTSLFTINVEKIGKQTEKYVVSLLVGGIKCTTVTYCYS